ILRRPPQGWARHIALRIPMHDPERWRSNAVAETLQDAAEFLTGDYWTLEFPQRRSAAPAPEQSPLSLPVKTQAVLPYSDGMDSRAVAGLLGRELGNGLVRVRVGAKSLDQPRNG